MNVPLPIDPCLPEIVGHVRDRGALVLVAEPGAGKTTRARRDGTLGGGRDLVLEPRRLATRLAAAHVAEELGEPLGKRVRYTIRFDDVAASRRLRFVAEACSAHTRRIARTVVPGEVDTRTLRRRAPAWGTLLVGTELTYAPGRGARIAPWSEPCELQRSSVARWS